MVPANVFDYELFAQAMITTQVDAMKRWIKENYKKTIEDIDYNASDRELDRINIKAHELRTLFRKVCNARDETLDSVEINTRHTIAELMSYIVFSCCRGSKENPLLPDKSIWLYREALNARNSMTDKAIDDFRRMVIEFMKYHTSADENSKFAKKYDIRVNRIVVEELLHSCTGIKLHYSDSGIVSSQNGIQEFIDQVILSCLKKTYGI